MRTPLHSEPTATCAIRVTTESRTAEPCREMVRQRWTRGRIVGLAFVSLALLRLLVTFWLDARRDPVRGGLESGDHRVVAVDDQGTLEVARRSNQESAWTGFSRTWRVRLLGVELSTAVPAAQASLGTTHAIDPRAVAWLRQSLANRDVRLDFDRRRFDSDGRWLVYVYVDGQLWNVEMVRSGWGRWERASEDAAGPQRALKQAESEARRAHRGLWSVRSSELVPMRLRG